MSRVAALWERDNRVCAICLHPVLRSEASIDHIVPRSQGGMRVPNNEQCAHRLCNSARMALSMEIVRKVVPVGHSLSQPRVIAVLRAENKVRARQAKALARYREFREQSRPSKRDRRIQNGVPFLEWQYERGRFEPA